MSNFREIDLSVLPPPELVEALSFEAILAEMLADFKAREGDAILLESDPAVKLLEVAAYRELLLRTDINERARQCLLAFAAAANLEHLGAFYGVVRALLDVGDEAAIPPRPPVFETDASLRSRIQLAPEALSVAGPKGAYVFHALSAGREIAEMKIEAPEPDKVTIAYTFKESGLSALAKDASAISPVPGDVVVTVLGRDGDGTAGEELLAMVEAALTDEFVRPLTDHVIVQAAEIVGYAIEATLEIPPGPDSSILAALAGDRVRAYVAGIHRLAGVVARSGIDAALHVPGVNRVVLTAPADDILCEAHQAPFCESISIEVVTVRPADPGDAIG